MHHEGPTPFSDLAQKSLRLLIIRNGPTNYRAPKKSRLDIRWEIIDGWFCDRFSSTIAPHNERRRKSWTNASSIERPAKKFGIETRRKYPPVVMAWYSWWILGSAQLSSRSCVLGCSLLWIASARRACVRPFLILDRAKTMLWLSVKMGWILFENVMTHTAWICIVVISFREPGNLEMGRFENGQFWAHCGSRRSWKMIRTLQTLKLLGGAG